MLILITENQLDDWVRANAEQAQGLVVELVWRLVAASCPKPLDRHFPLGDSISQHGPDGVLEVALGLDPFVPEGHSIWEIGTSLRAGDKATADYNQRTKDTPEEVRRESTFVFVTPLSGRRDWEHTWKKDAQASWSVDRRARGDWKDVRVIDGTKLIDWLHQFLAVELWLAQVILRLPEQQIETPEQRWSTLRSIGEPPLTPDVFLANREEACAKLKEVFDDAVVQLKLATHFPDQVTDFVSAYLASLDPDSRIDAVSRCLIVSGFDAWDAISTLANRLILIADSALDLDGDTGAVLIQKARRAGHAIVFGGPHGGIPDPTSVPLHTPRVYQIQAALVKAGYGEERARTLAQKSDGNLGSLRRCLQNLSLPPAWAEGVEAHELANAVLLGSWTDRSESDRDVVEGIVGRAYGEWIGEMRKVALRPTTPLIQREGNWKFIARYEGWYALGARIFDDQLDRFRTTAVSALREQDPQFQLPPEERYLAGISGRTLAHSRLLRSGLAESLALLGSHPNALLSCTGGKATSTAILAVRSILADGDWAHWASLNGFLPLLAEAAPEQFLSAVQEALDSAPCPFDELFAQEDRGVFGTTYMSGLLWALETLAWDADYLARVVLILGELALHDPGGRWMNRPANSLTAILLPWLPQTCASIAMRVAAVKGLLAELPDVGWKLLLSLLPRAHSTSSGTRRPEWRATIPDDWKQEATREEYREQVSSYAELAIAEAKLDVSKLAVLIGYLEGLPRPAGEEILGYLSSDAVRTLPETDRQVLWNKLRDLARKHRRFADANWAMEPEQVEQIASLAEHLSPEAPFFRHQWLFREGDFDLYEEMGDFDEQASKLEARRRQAIEEIATERDTSVVVEFAKTVEAPWLVGGAYASVASEEADGIVLPALLESDEPALSQFARGYILGRFHNRGWQWVDGIGLSEWTATPIGQLLALLPFTQETWKRSRRLLGEDESAYWTQVTGFAFRAESGIESAIEKLLRYKRPYAAIHCVHAILHDQHSLDTGLAARALMQGLESTESPHQMDIYYVVEIIKALQEHSDTAADDLFSVEWAYLPVLDGHNRASPRFLERRLAEEPAFFCELIRLIFRSRKEDHPPKEPGFFRRIIRLIFRSHKEKQPAEEPAEARKNIASNAYRLLHTWQTPPGSRVDGTFDGDALTLWLDSVKQECTETGHLESAMSMVGHVLVHVPADPDGLWINHSAAAALNAKDAQEMRRGYSTELYNMRGPHWVDPTGKPERELAANYRAKAEAVDEAGYPRLAAMLRQRADTYEHEAEQVRSRGPFDDY